MRCERDRQVEQGLVFDDPAGLDAAARGEDDLRLGVVDAGRELLGGEAAEHHRMHRADAGAGEHGDDRLRDHRHVDQHPVAHADPEIGEHRAERRRLVEEFAIADGPLRAGDRAVVIERDRFAAAGLDMPVERVEAGVEARVGEPAAIDAALGVEDALGRLRPRDLARGFRPEGLRIGAPVVIGLPVAASSFRSLAAEVPRAVKQRARIVAPGGSKRNAAEGGRRAEPIGSRRAPGDRGVCRGTRNSIWWRWRR